MTKPVTLEIILKTSEIMLASHIKQINNQELLHGYPSHHFRGLKTNTINLTHPGYSRQQRTTGRRPAHSLKVNELLDCFSSFDPNAVHSSSAVARWSGLSFGSPCALAIGDRVTSARLRPRFRHVHRRSRFVRWQHNPGTQIKTPTAALRPAAFVACNLPALRQGFAFPLEEQAAQRHLREIKATVVTG